jgi:hypothetical protein
MLLSGMGIQYFTMKRISHCCRLSTPSKYSEILQKTRPGHVPSFLLCRTEPFEHHRLWLVLFLLMQDCPPKETENYVLPFVRRVRGDTRTL